LQRLGEALLSSSGELTAAGRQLISTVFDRFDSNKDGELSLDEFNAMRGAEGEPPIDGDTLGLILQAQNIPITARATLAKVVTWIALLFRECISDVLLGCFLLVGGDQFEVLPGEDEGESAKAWLLRPCICLPSGALSHRT